MMHAMLIVFGQSCFYFVIFANFHDPFVDFVSLIDQMLWIFGLLISLAELKTPYRANKAIVNAFCNGGPPIVGLVCYISSSIRGLRTVSNCI
jgi:hypothetical protein